MESKMENRTVRHKFWKEVLVISIFLLILMLIIWLISPLITFLLGRQLASTIDRQLVPLIEQRAYNRSLESSIPSAPRHFTFQDLPSGAVNGEWSIQALESGISMSESIEQLATRVEYVVRAKIIDERYRVVNNGPVGYRVPYLYSIYELQILDVYKGDVAVGDIIAISQRAMTWRQTENYSDEYGFLREGQMYIRLPLEVGDDLILFLSFVETFSQGETGIILTTPGSGVIPPSDKTNMWIFNRVQGIYRYTPQELRDNDNWVFEPVNPHNNLVLTEADLQQLRDSNRLDYVPSMRSNRFISITDIECADAIRFSDSYNLSFETNAKIKQTVINTILYIYGFDICEEAVFADICQEATVFDGSTSLIDTIKDLREFFTYGSRRINGFSIALTGIGTDFMRWASYSEDSIWVYVDVLEVGIIYPCNERYPLSSKIHIFHIVRRDDGYKVVGLFGDS